MITSEQGNAWMKLQPGWYYNNSVGNLVLSRSSQNSIICLWVCCLINLSMNNLLPPSFLTRLSNPVLPTPISHFIFSRSFYLSFPIPFPSWVLPTLHLPAFLPHSLEVQVSHLLSGITTCVPLPSLSLHIGSGGIEEWCIETVEIQDLMVQRRVSVNMDGTNNKKTQTEPTEDTFALPFKP